MGGLNNPLYSPFLAERLGSYLIKRPRKKPEVSGFRDAAIVVPLFKKPIADGVGDSDGAQSEWHLLFTVRSESLRHHAGQISFPGGAIDEGETIEVAAARELDEEVGLKVNRFLGQMSWLPSPAKFNVKPVVALIDYPAPLTINAAEVSEVFSVPLAVLAGIEPRVKVSNIGRHERKIHFYDYGERLIWGLTANVVAELIECLRLDSVV